MTKVTAQEMESVRPVIEFTAGKYAGNGIQIEDLLQEGALGALEAEKRYNSEKGASFATYASYWIEKKISEYIRHNRGTAADDIDSIETAPAAVPAPVIDEMDFSDTPGLTEKEAEILSLYFNGRMTLSGIGAHLGMRRAQVKQMKNRALRKVKAGTSGRAGICTE